MKLTDFDYYLPDELIAQTPIEPRDGSKMLYFDKKTGEVDHLFVRDLVNLLNENHVLVFNKSRVIPARIRFGENKEVLLCKKIDTMDYKQDPSLCSGGRNVCLIGQEILEQDENVILNKMKHPLNETWEVMVRLGKKNKVGDMHFIDENVGFEILEILDGGTRIVRFFVRFNEQTCREKALPCLCADKKNQWFNLQNGTNNNVVSLRANEMSVAIQNQREINGSIYKIEPEERGSRRSNNSQFNFFSWLKKHGEMPLPPYIKGKSKDERYQTTFSNDGDGASVAAPTAGLHFTEDLLNKLKSKGVGIEFVHLDVGLGTFLPVKTENILDHKIHHESFSLDSDVAQRLNEAKKQGKKIIAVGTTTVRVLETSTRERNGIFELFASSGETNIFIYPSYKWKFVDEIITNFHLPKSSLLMLISSFIGREEILNLYKEAILKKYRFYSFGDAMYLRV